MGCWCPKESNNRILKFVIIIDIIAIFLMFYITWQDGNNWLLYAPSLLLLIGSVLILWDKGRD